MKTSRLAIMGAATLLLLGFASGRVYADSTSFTVTLNTSGLIGNVGGPFSLAFIFTDGSGLGDANNTVLLSGFDFGTGSAGSVSSSVGGASGNLSSGITLTDSAFFNELVSGFTPGSTLGFTVNMTTFVDADGTPDQFSLAILDNNGFNINTQDLSGASSLLTVNLDSASPSIQTFASDLTPAPTVVPAVVPEPATLLLLGTGLAGIGLRRRRAKSR